MSANTGDGGHNVRLLRQGQVDAGVASGLGSLRLAEVTHLPGGVPSAQIETISVPAGNRAAEMMAGGEAALLHVVAGEARVQWGAGLARDLRAGPGDTLLVPAGVTFRAVNSSKDVPLQFFVVRSA